MSSEVEYPPESTTLSLVNGILVDLQQLIEQQLQLTRRQVEDEVRQRSAAAAIFVLGFAILFLDSIVMILTAAYGLYWAVSPAGSDPAALPLWGCFAVVSVVLIAVGGILAYVGRKKFLSIHA
jgi:hypothetical protein